MQFEERIIDQTKIAPICDKGDCIAEQIGRIELKDGRVFLGALLTFPEGPPDEIPISVVWRRTLLRLTLKA